MKSLLKRIASRVSSFYMHEPPYYKFKRLDEVSAGVQIQQLLLQLAYKERFESGRPRPTFDDVEFSLYSQNGEDGILWYIFSLIGTTNKTVVEIGAGDGIENNSANLIVNHGWKGFLLDASPERVKAAETFYASLRQTRLWPPRITLARIDSGNANETVAASGVTGAIDLLSIDIDGIDYWVWEALTVIEPRLVVVEFNNLWNAEAAFTVPNDPNFVAQYDSPYGANYSGATLAAFVKLAARKSYRLVGSQRYGFNAFFLKNGVGEAQFPAVDPSSCLEHPFAIYARTVRQKAVRGRSWVAV